MTAEEYELARQEMGSGKPVRLPQRSAVAPVNRERGFETSATIKALVQGLEPKVASEALARAETLAKLTPSEQTALRCALVAASESGKRAEIVQIELEKLKGRLERTEKEHVEESQSFRRQSDRAEKQVDSLREDLAVAVAASAASESRFRMRRIFFWLALGVTLSISITFSLVFYRPPVPGPVPGPAPAMTAMPALQHREADAAEPVGTPLPDAPAGKKPVVQRSLDRLELALARVPLSQVDTILNEANDWLVASHIPPCTVPFAEGEEALLVGKNRRRARPLATSFANCAEGVEHVTQ
jgi:hypothetical protein